MQISPEPILRLISAHWAAGSLGAAAAHSIFTHIDRGAGTADEIAARAGISPRGAQALLDALVGLGLAKVAGGRYANSDEAATFLVEGKPAYLGAMAQLVFHDWAGFLREIPDIVKRGGPGAKPLTEGDQNPFWETLVPAIAPLAAPVAQAVVERLGVAGAGPISILDVGGGSGIFAATLLRANPRARAAQLDWPNVNAIARRFVAHLGVGERFSTIDGDFRTTDFGRAAYDIAIYSNIAHQESPASNIAIFKKFRAALKPGGTLVVSDFILRDDRTGHPFALLFSMNMLVATPEGASYREADYRAWAAEAGFTSVSTQPTPGASTIVYAS